MNLEETRNALKKVFENKLTVSFGRILRGEVDTKGDSLEPMRQLGEVLLTYLDCGGVIEEGTSFKFAENLLEQNGYNIKNLNVKNLLDERWFTEGLLMFTGGEGLKYSEAVKRNPTLTLGELRTILDNYARINTRKISDLGERLSFMKEQVDLGCVLQMEPIYLKSQQYGTLEKIKANPEYLKLYQEIYAKSKENLSIRKKEKEQEQEPKTEEGGFISPEIEEEIKSWLTTEETPLKKREKQLSALEAEEKKIAEAEALIDKQTKKEGKDIGEN